MSSLDHGYWKSLAELERDSAPDQGPGQDGDPMEFPATATDETVSDPLSRRNFVQIMGASMALAGVAGTGCKRYEKDEIVPLSRRPEDQTPGVPQQYATAWDFAGFGQALVATSYEGRPIKIDGNPEHPFIEGGTVPGTRRHGGSSAFAQASILNLYDPDRSRTLMREGRGATFGDFRAWLEAEAPQLRSGSTRIRVLSEATSSPTVARLREQLRTQSLPGLQWFEWESVSFDNERAGTRMAFGDRPMRTLAHLDRAKTIVALDCDLFVEHPAGLMYQRDWARGRRFGTSTLGEGQMNRLWSIESTFTSTGAVADHRLPLRSELVLPFLMGLEARLGNGSPPPAEFLAEEKIARFLEVLAEELGENRGSAVLVAGRRQPPEVHALVARINEAIGAVGRTLEYLPDPDPSRLDHGQAIARLVSELQQGQVDYLFILGGNPAFDAPSDLDFAGALAKVKRASVHLSDYEDETSQLTTWHVPRAHYLEAWGDVRTYDGTVTLAQPLIQPMFGGISVIELLQLLAGAEPDAIKEVQATFAELGASSTWRKAVHDGFVARSKATPESTGLSVGQLAPFQLTPAQRGPSRVANGALEVVFAPSSQTWDGRFANNAWLQETPDFLTKVTWDNFAMVAPATAKDLGLANDTMIKVTIGDRSMSLPCYTMPGQAPYSIGVVLGGGRRAAGRTGGHVQHKHKAPGFDVNVLRASSGWDVAAGASVAGTGEHFTLASTQEHWDIRDGLKKDVAQKGIADRMDILYPEASLTEASKPGWSAQAKPHFPVESLWDEKVYPEDRVYKWGMAIDMGACTGCNACAVACQSENNIPVVGKKNVIKNREMNWIRIDRYFSGSPESPEIVHQPLACVHCEMAPCEQVCPVGATIHSSEGLNEMTYNRCIGTRYCLNNCPYRVRRFNFFDYNKEFKEARNKVRRLLFNPEVTVRHRGVMEKCTYCVQRIQNAKITAKNQRVAIEDGDITTACQAACPSEAIVFGDLNDPNSRLTRLHADRRSYSMLNNELNTKPRTQFLARVRNPNPKLESPAHGNSH
jgi:molybdopterin-containing oxidoreductase family iron-sulfur binding subunit